MQDLRLVGRLAFCLEMKYFYSQGWNGSLCSPISPSVAVVVWSSTALQHCSTAADWSIVKELWADLEIVALMNGFNLGNDLRSLVRGVSSVWQLSLKNWLYIDNITTNRCDFGSFNVKREFYGGCAFCYCHNSGSGWFSHIYSIISIVKTFKLEIVTPLSLLQRNTQSPQRERAAGI